MHAPAYGLRDAPAVFRWALRRYLLNSADSSAQEGLEFRVAAFDLYQHPISRTSGRAVGAIATHIDDILGCGEPNVSANVRGFSGRHFGL